MRLNKHGRGHMATTKLMMIQINGWLKLRAAILLLMRTLGRYVNLVVQFFFFSRC